MGHIQRVLLFGIILEFTYHQLYYLIYSHALPVFLFRSKFEDQRADSVAALLRSLLNQMILRDLTNFFIYEVQQKFQGHCLDQTFVGLFHFLCQLQIFWILIQSHSLNYSSLYFFYFVFCLEYYQLLNLSSHLMSSIDSHRYLQIQIGSIQTSSFEKFVTSILH